MKDSFSSSGIWGLYLKNVIYRGSHLAQLSSQIDIVDVGSSGHEGCDEQDCCLNGGGRLCHCAAELWVVSCVFQQLYHVRHQVFLTRSKDIIIANICQL